LEELQEYIRHEMSPLPYSIYKLDVEHVKAKRGLTSRGLHLRDAGKDKLISLLIRKIEMHQRKPHAETPMSVGWKEDLLTEQPHEELVNKVSKGQHGGSVVKDINLGNPLKPKRTRKAPSMKTDDFYGKTKCGVVDQDEIFNLHIFSQNIRGLGEELRN
jgi:hypothetical protein